MTTNIITIVEHDVSITDEAVEIRESSQSSSKLPSPALSSASLSKKPMTVSATTVPAIYSQGMNCGSGKTQAKTNQHHN